MSALVRPLLHDSYDIVGDIHGESGALRTLLARLGCDPEHARVERPLVFVGDLIDRGPDSIEVLEIVGSLVEAGVAQAVLGNHELNVIMAAPKEGNGWIIAHPAPGDRWHSHGRANAFDSRAANERERSWVLDLLSSLPLALESDSMRVVHAAWIPDAIESARAAPDLSSLIDDLNQLPNTVPADAPSEAELTSPARQPAFHRALAEHLAHEQNSMALKVLTSGPEQPLRPALQPRFTSGRWRMTERDAWWEHDADERAVVFGHYWRRRPGSSMANAALFAGAAPNAWFGQHSRAFCVDYSVGRRYEARHTKSDLNRDTGLAALRWPERLLYFDNADEPLSTAGFRPRN